MRKLHTISWDKIKRPRKEGGLCLTAAKPKNLALLAKLNWRMKTEKDQLWAKVLGLIMQILIDVALEHGLVSREENISLSKEQSGIWGLIVGLVSCMTSG